MALNAPSVGLESRGPNKVEANTDIRDYTQYSKYIDNRTDDQANFAQALGVVDQFILGRETVKMKDELNKLKLKQSAIYDEMKQDPNDWTMERYAKYQDRINQVAEEQYAASKELDVRLQGLYNEKAEAHAENMAAQFQSLALEKQYKYENKVLTGAMATSAQALFDSRLDLERSKQNLVQLQEDIDAYLQHAGFQKGTEAYKDQFRSTFSKLTQDSLVELIQTRQLTPAKQLYSMYQQYMDTSTQTKINVMIFNEEERLREEAERKAREAARDAAAGIGLTPEEKEAAARRAEEIKLKKAYTLGNLSKEQRSVMIDQRVYDYGKRTYEGLPEEEKKKLLEQFGPDQEDAIYISLVPQEVRFGIIQGLDNELKENARSYDAKQLGNALLVDKAMLVRKVEQSNNKNVYLYSDPTEYISKALEYDLITQEEATSLITFYEGLSSQEKSDMRSIVNNANTESDFYNLMYFNELSSSSLIFELDAQENPMHFLISEKGLSMDDATKLFSRYKTAKKFQSEKEFTQTVNAYVDELVSVKKSINDYVLTILGEEKESDFFKKGGNLKGPSAKEVASYLKNIIVDQIQRDVLILKKDPKYEDYSYTDLFFELYKNKAKFIGAYGSYLNREYEHLISLGE